MASDVLACAVCFGAAHGPLLDAARVGVLVMVAVTCAVLALFARFFLRIAKNGDSSHFENGDSPHFENGDSRRFVGGR
jgi:hypothetical protein